MPTPMAAPIFGKAPMLRVAIGMQAGIAAADACAGLGIGPWPMLITAILATMLLAADTVWRRPWTDRWVLPSLYVALFALGWTLYGVRYPASPWPLDEEGPGRVQLAVRLDGEPRPTARSIKCAARVERWRDSDWHTASGSVMLYFPKADSGAYRCGDRLLVSAKPSRPSQDLGDDHFDYRRHLLRRGMHWQCYVGEGQALLLSRDGAGGLKAWSLRVQHRLVRALKRSGLEARELGVAEALLLGYRDDVDPQLKTQYRDAGITHLLCVSGLHVGIVGALAGMALAFLGRRRAQRIAKGLGQLAAIWAFALVSGMAPSTMRAAFMFSLLIAGRMAERNSPSLNGLAASAVVLLAGRPMLMFDLGWQLSYAAVLGILTLTRPLEQLLPISDYTPEYESDELYLKRLSEHWPKHLLRQLKRVLQNLLRRVWQLACLSTAAQLGTLPLVLLNFHQFPTYFLIANLLVIPLAGVLLGTALLLLASMALLPRCAADLLCSLTAWELRGIDRLTAWVGSLPCATIDHIRCDLPHALLLGGALVIAAVAMQRLTCAKMSLYE